MNYLHVYVRVVVQNGRILSRASERLNSIRDRKHENSQKLRTSIKEWARKMYSEGMSESPNATIRRDRQCVPVKAGRQVYSCVFSGER